MVCKPSLWVCDAVFSLGNLDYICQCMEFSRSPGRCRRSSSWVSHIFLPLLRYLCLCSHMCADVDLECPLLLFPTLRFDTGTLTHCLIDRPGSPRMYRLLLEDLKVDKAFYLSTSIMKQIRPSMQPAAIMQKSKWIKKNTLLGSEGFLL